MQNVILNNHELESRLPRELSVTSNNTDGITLMAESEPELKSLLMRVKEESEFFTAGFQHSKS